MVKLKKLRPRCFFDIIINEESIGRIVFELFNDVCPRTCENFKSLCTGERGLGKTSQKPLHYKNVLFHRVIQNFMIQSGDFSLGNGKGGESIYGGTFEDESFDVKHDRPFLLSMANRGKNTNGSQFFITLNPVPHLDGVHVVFGHVISGQDVVQKIAEQPVNNQKRPLTEVRIGNCGELIPQIKAKAEGEKKKSKQNNEGDSDSSDSDGSSDSDSDSSSSSSGSASTSSDEDDGSKKRKKIRNQKNDTNELNDSEKKDDAGDDADHEEGEIISLFNPKYSVKIDPDEIPEVPKNRFLSRNFVAPNSDQQRRAENNENNEEGSRKNNIEERKRLSYTKRISYTKSGRKIKGRGLIRYRTPSPDSRRYRRSETPPHWKMEQSKVKPFKQIVSEYRRRISRESGKDDQEEIENRKKREDGFDRHQYRDRFSRRNTEYENGRKRKSRSRSIGHQDNPSERFNDRRARQRSSPDVYHRNNRHDETKHFQKNEEEKDIQKKHSENSKSQTDRKEEISFNKKEEDHKSKEKGDSSKIRSYKLADSKTESKDVDHKRRNSDRESEQIKENGGLKKHDSKSNETHHNTERNHRRRHAESTDLKSRNEDEIKKSQYPKENDKTSKENSENLSKKESERKKTKDIGEQHGDRHSRRNRDDHRTHHDRKRSSSREKKNNTSTYDHHHDKEKHSSSHKVLA